MFGLSLGSLKSRFVLQRKDYIMQYIQIQITVPTAETAEKTAAKLVQEKLVACAQVCGTVHSFYSWQGKAEMNKELLLMVKTEASLFDKVVSSIREEHPYECPQIVALPIVSCNEDYLDWMQKALCND